MSSNRNGDDVRGALFGNRSQPPLTGSRSNNPYNSSSSSSSSSSQQQQRAHNEQSQNLFEQQNNDLTDQLHDKVNRLKTLTINIGNEIKESNQFLDNDFSSTMDGIAGGLKTTIGKLNHMINTGGSKHMCYLVLFMLLVFLLIYYLIK